MENNNSKKIIAIVVIVIIIVVVVVVKLVTKPKDTDSIDNNIDNVISTNNSSTDTENNVNTGTETNNNGEENTIPPEVAKNHIRAKSTGKYITSPKKNLTYSSEKDKNMYQSNVITNTVTTFNGNGKKAYIDSNKDLYVNNTKVEASVKFKTMYDKTIKTTDGAEFIVLITTNGELYAVSIEDATLAKLSTKKKVVNFVDKKFVGDNNTYTNSRPYIFVLEEDGNFYEVFSGMRYDDSIVMLFDGLLVYSDNTVSNTNGFMLQNSSGKDYKVKYAFNAKDNYYGTVTYIVTEDNKLAFGYEKEYYMMIYEASSNVTSVDYNKSTSKLSIKLANETISVDNARCNSKYCPN